MKVTVIVEPGRVQLDAAGSALSGLEPDEDTAEIGRELVAAVRAIARRAVRTRGRRELVHVEGWTAHAPITDAPTDDLTAPAPTALDADEDPPCSTTSPATPSPGSPCPSPGAAPATGGSPPPRPARSTTGTSTCGGPTTPEAGSCATSTPSINGHSLPADPLPADSPPADPEPPAPPLVAAQDTGPSSVSGPRRFPPADAETGDELAAAYGQQTRPDRGVVPLTPDRTTSHPAPARAAPSARATSDRARPRVPPEQATDAHIRAWCVRHRIDVPLRGVLSPEARRAYADAYHGRSSR